MRISTTADHSANAFELLRFLAAFAVLFSHSFVLYGLPEPFLAFGLPLANVAVYVFFVISGFLVCQSWGADPNLPRFAARRALRLLPALLVAVAVTVFVIGPLMTTLPILEYFQSRETWSYLISNASLVIGRFTLPGVFEANPFPGAVNGSLWTLRYEVLMYAALGTVGAATTRSGMRWACLTLLALFAIGWSISRAMGIVAYALPVPGASLIGLGIDWMHLALFGTFFFAGSSLYWIRDRLHLSVSAVALLALAAWFTRDSLLAMPFLWLLLPYATLVAAYRAPVWLRPFGKQRDLSYGIYIYAFPVQQAVCWLALSAGAGWLAAFTASALITLALAGLSWHYVERHALRCKPRPPHAVLARPGMQLGAQGDR